MTNIMRALYFIGGILAPIVCVVAAIAGSPSTFQAISGWSVVALWAVAAYRWHKRSLNTSRRYDIVVHTPPGVDEREIANRVVDELRTGPPVNWTSASVIVRVIGLR